MYMVLLKSKTLKILNCFINEIVDESFLNKYDKICLACEKFNGNSDVLEEKVNKLLKIEKKGEKMVRIYDFLNELDSYDWLDKNEHRNIEFIKKDDDKKTPDFKSENKGRQVFYTEVKTIRLGEDEEEILIQSYLSKSGPSRALNGNRDWRIGLEKKVKDDVEKAESQFESIGAKNKILFLFYTIGIDCSIYLLPNPVALDVIFGGKFFENFENQYNMKIIRLPVS